MKNFLISLCIIVVLLLPVTGCQEEDSGPADYTINFDLGYEGAADAPAAVKVKSGQSLGDKFPADPQRDDYEFDAWYAGGEKYTASTPVRKNITLLANWRALPPAEAELFKNISLITPFKDYEHGNPLMTQDFGADPNMLEWDGRLYVYMTADSLRWSGGQVIEHNYGTITSLRVLSTTDLVNWTQHPELKRVDISGTIGWLTNIWAPSLAVKEINGTKKIFLYFANSGGSVGVISAENPLGPWTSPLSTSFINSSTPGVTNIPDWPDPVWIFDPSVLVNDDGKAYIYFGGGTPAGGPAETYESNHPRPKTMRSAQLGADMISLVPNSVVPIDLPYTFEASEINKINGRYYFSYSTNPQVNHYASDPQGRFPEAALIGDSFAIAYADSANPLGPWNFRGAVLHNPGKMFDHPYNNNHHKIFQYKNKWYILYHTKILMKAMNQKSDPVINMDYNYRSTNIDAVSFSAEGRIRLVEGTRTGIEQVGSFNPFNVTDASTMAVQAGITTEEYELSGTKRMRVNNISDGDWIAVKGVDFGGQSASKFWCRITPPSAGVAVIQIRQGGLDGKAVGYVVINSGSESTTIEADLLQKMIGKTDIVFVFHGGGLKFEQWQFK